MIPDILVTWPTHLDYPLFRYNMIAYQKYFRSLTIVFSNHHMEKDYSNFIRANLSFANFIEYKGDDPDWRNGTVNAGLNIMPKDGHVLFLEQDFFWNDKFLDKILEDYHDVIYFNEGNRIHPAFALIKRELVDKTCRDFSAYPNTFGDHFGRFFSDLILGININELGAERDKDYWHMNGLSQEYINYKNDQPFYNKEDFLCYNNESRYLPIEHHPEFFQISYAIDRKYGHPGTNHLQKFFP
jgi:hypothetical protein